MEGKASGRGLRVCAGARKAPTSRTSIRDVCFISRSGLYRVVVTVFFAEGEEEVAEEVPNGRDDYGDEFEEVEILDEDDEAEAVSSLSAPAREGTFEEEDGEGADAEAYEGDEEEFKIFAAHLLIMAAESPDTVEEVVGGSRKRKAASVGHEVGPMKDFDEEYEEGIVDYHA